jgi:hypothetical protein
MTYLTHRYEKLSACFNLYIAADLGSADGTREVLGGFYPPGLRWRAKLGAARGDLCDTTTKGSARPGAHRGSRIAARPSGLRCARCGPTPAARLLRADAPGSGRNDHLCEGRPGHRPVRRRRGDGEDHGPFGRWPGSDVQSPSCRGDFRRDRAARRPAAERGCGGDDGVRAHRNRAAGLLDLRAQRAERGAQTHRTSVRTAALCQSALRGGRISPLTGAACPHAVATFRSGRRVARSTQTQNYPARDQSDAGIDARERQQATAHLGQAQMDLA